MNKKISLKELIFFLIVSLLTLLISLIVIAREETPEWKDYQSEFKDIVAENFGNVDLSDIPDGIQQIWVEDLDRVDRCITCHQGISWKGLESVDNPWKTHPNSELIANHPPEKFGCTICHGGQGYAVYEYDAHGFVENWDEPLLSKTIGSEYNPRDPSPLEQIRCNNCHRYDFFSQ